MSEPKPMSPVEKIKALKAAAEEKKNQEAREAAERAEKERNEHGEKVKEARKKFEETKKIADECDAIFRDTEAELVGVEDAELREEIEAIVAGARTDKEQADAALTEAEDALRNLEKLESTEASPTEQQAQEKNERELSIFDYESKVSSHGDFITLFNKETDFAKILRGEKEGFQHPKEAARAVQDINELARNHTKRAQESETLKKDVKKYLESPSYYGEGFVMARNAKTESEKKAALDKIGEKLAEVDGYLYKMLVLAYSGDSSLKYQAFTMPQPREDHHSGDTLEGLVSRFPQAATPINYEQMKKISDIVNDFRNEGRELVYAIQRMKKNAV